MCLCVIKYRNLTDGSIYFHFGPFENLGYFQKVNLLILYEFQYLITLLTNFLKYNNINELSNNSQS